MDVPGQLCWRIAGNDGEPALHWRNTPRDRWQPYSLHPLKVADSWQSRGFPTFCKLIQHGWQTVKWDGEKYVQA